MDHSVGHQWHHTTLQKILTVAFDSSIVDSIASKTGEKMVQIICGLELI
jgi:hypothetical protein